MVLAASGGVKAVLAMGSGCRWTGNGATACVQGGCAWPAGVGHNHRTRCAPAALVAEHEGEIGARSHAVWLVDDLIAVCGRTDVQTLVGAGRPDHHVVGIEFVVGVAIDIDQVAVFPGRVSGTATSAYASIYAWAEYGPYVAFDGFTACQVQCRDQRVDRARYALAGNELLVRGDRNCGGCADNDQSYKRFVQTEGALASQAVG
jgi:hypothetical protein